MRILMILIAGLAFGTGPLAAQTAYNTVALSGQAAPGVAAGGVYSSFVNSPVLNSAGQTAFTGNLTGTGITASNNSGIWAGSTGSLALVARTGNAAPGLPGSVYAGLDRGILNDTGEVAFRSSATVPGSSTSFQKGMWAGSVGNVSLYAITGDTPPGVPAGVTYSPLNPAFNNNGQMAFDASLSGPGINASNYTGIWYRGSSGLALVARGGQQAPGLDAGTHFTGFIPPSSILRAKSLSLQA